MYLVNLVYNTPTVCYAQPLPAHPLVIRPVFASSSLRRQSRICFGLGNRLFDLLAHWPMRVTFGPIHDALPETIFVGGSATGLSATGAQGYVPMMSYYAPLSPK
jgi:hypothetical protein